MWAATVSSVACGSIQEKFSNLKFVENRVRSHLDSAFSQMTISVNHFVSFIYFVIKSEGLFLLLTLCLGPD